MAIFPVALRLGQTAKGPGAIWADPLNQSLKDRKRAILTMLTELLSRALNIDQGKLSGSLDKENKSCKKLIIAASAAPSTFVTPQTLLMRIRLKSGTLGPLAVRSIVAQCLYRRAACRELRLRRTAWSIGATWADPPK